MSMSQRTRFEAAMQRANRSVGMVRSMVQAPSADGARWPSPTGECVADRLRRRVKQAWKVAEEAWLPDNRRERTGPARCWRNAAKDVAVLEIRVLGGLEVIRDGALATLPPSRKTRALLAYLALTRSPHRREQLCEMFWDVPDDPRGALRWSLSKIRPLVDEPAISAPGGGPSERRTAHRGARDRLLFRAGLRRRQGRGDRRPGACGVVIPRAAAGRSRTAGEQRIPQLAVGSARGRAQAADTEFSAP